MTIYVKILGPTDRTIIVDVEAGDTIASIKTKIHGDTAIPLCDLELYKKNTELEDTSPLSATACFVRVDRVHEGKACAANDAIRGEICPINGYPQKNQRTK